MVGGGSVCSDWGVLALVMDFREVRMGRGHRSQSVLDGFCDY